MADLTLKDKQLQESRMKVITQEEEMKQLSVMRVKLDRERQLIVVDMKKMEQDIREMRATYEGQIRLIKNVTGHAKNQGAILNEKG